MKSKSVATMLIAGGALAFTAQFPAKAEFIVSFTQVGSDVVATGSGTIDTAGLTFGGTSAGFFASVQPSVADYQAIAGSTSQVVDLYTGFSGPTSWSSSPAFGSGTSVGSAF